MWLRALLCPELVRSHGEHWFHLGLIILREFSHHFPWWGISLVVGIWHFYFWGPRFNPWSNPWELRSHKLHSVTKKKKKKLTLEKQESTERKVANTAWRHLLVGKWQKAQKCLWRDVASVFKHLSVPSLLLLAVVHFLKDVPHRRGPQGRSSILERGAHHGMMERCRFWCNPSCFSESVSPLHPAGYNQLPNSYPNRIDCRGGVVVGFSSPGSSRLKLEDTKITTFGFLFKCCIYLQTSFTGVIWQKKCLYHAIGSQTGTDGRSLNRTHFCSCEENVPGGRSHWTWNRLPVSGGWAPTLGRCWSNFLQKKNLYQVEDWMSLFPRHPPILSSSHLGPFWWTNIYWAPTVWHTSSTEHLLYITSGLLRLASCASHSCGPPFSAGFTQLCAEAAWLDFAAGLHHGPLCHWMPRRTHL